MFLSDFIFKVHRDFPSESFIKSRVQVKFLPENGGQNADTS